MRLRTRIRLALVALGAVLTFATVALASALVLPWLARSLVEREGEALGVRVHAAQVQVRLRENEVVLGGVRAQAGGTTVARAARVVLAYDPAALLHGGGALRRMHARDGTLDLPALLPRLPPSPPAGRLSVLRIERMALGGPEAGPSPVLDSAAITGLDELRRGGRARLEVHLALGAGRATMEGELAADPPARDGAAPAAGSPRGYRLEGNLTAEGLPAEALGPLLDRWGLRDARGPVEIRSSPGVVSLRLEPPRAALSLSLDLDLRGNASALAVTSAGGTRLQGAFEWRGILGVHGSGDAPRAPGLEAAYEGTVRGTDISLAGSDARTALAGGLTSAAWSGRVGVWPTLQLDGRLTAPTLRLALSRDGAAVAVHLTNASVHAKGTPLAAGGLAASSLAVDEVRVVGERGSSRLEGVTGGQLFAGLDGEIALAEIRADRVEVAERAGPALVPWLGATGLALRDLELGPDREGRAAVLHAEQVRYRGGSLEAEAERIEARSLAAAPGAASLTVREVTVDAPLLRLALAPDGPGRGPRPANALALSIAQLHSGRPGRLVLEDGRFTPPVRTEATELEGRVTGLDTRSGAGGAFAASAKLSGEGALRGRGTFGLAPLHGEGELTATNLDLSRLTPYAERYADTRVEGGRGDLRVRATLAAGRVDAVAEAVLRHPQLVPADEETPARGETVRAAVALLGDGSGTVRLRVPFAGPVSDLRLDLGGTLERAVHRAARDAATLAFPSLEVVRAARGQTPSPAPPDPPEETRR